MTSFQQLRALTEALVLTHFKAEHRTILCTDASDMAIGAALHQLDPQGRERPIAFYSKKLTSAELYYSTCERELLALKTVSCTSSTISLADQC
eukprot:703163-Hanusia_phi.AAC.1